MPKYKYLVKTRDSKSIRGVVEAGSKDELLARLRSKGFFIVSIEELAKKGEGLSFLSSFSRMKGKHSSIKLSDLVFLSRNLSVTLSSGVTLLRSLEILSSQSESVKMTAILKDCNRYIKEGLSLSEAVAKYPNTFSPLWLGLIEVGEASGNLPYVLEKLADYLEMREGFERKIKSALIYPCILLAAAGLAMFAFFKFILPKFTTLFDQFDVELPLPTQIIFNISSFLEKNSLLLFIGVTLLGVASFLFTKRPKTRKIWEKIKLRLPLIGSLVSLTCLERFTSVMHILLDSGLPLVYTLDVASRSIGNSVLERNLIFIKNRVRDGAPLSSEFRRTNMFPLLISEMAKIGEETGTMPQVFNKISSHYQKELNTRVERMIAAFEPLMIVFMGVLIGGIVISLFLPLFKLSTLGG